MVSKCIIATNLIHSTNKVEILKYNDMVGEISFNNFDIRGHAEWCESFPH